jgi:hypothetical protein
MPKFTYIQTNFTSGELTPRMRGRVDVARYQNGADTIENAIVSVHGGADRRPGLRYLATAKFSGNKAARVIDYVFNQDQAYVLEFDEGFIRFFTSTGAVILKADLSGPLELASPYTESQLNEVTYVQGADTMFLFHPNVPTYRLRRISAAVWTMQPVPWVTEPFAEIGHTPNSTLSLSATTVGAGRTFTAGSATVPDAPTIGTPVALNAAINVHFTPPANNGGLPITGYTATSSPGGFTGTGTGSPIRVAGLTNGTPYTFTVTATNGFGTGAASAASVAIAPDASQPAVQISASATPLDMILEVGNGEQLNLAGPTASGNGGYTPYTFAWVKLTGAAGITVTTANQAQVRIRSAASNRELYAALRCTVTDASGASATVDVNVTTVHGIPS